MIFGGARSIRGGRRDGDHRSTGRNRRNSPWWTQLWVWVLIAMALGIALGSRAPDVAASMGPLGDAFIKLIRMLIAPIIFCTVVTGIAHMADMARVGRVAIKAIVYFEVMTTVALIIGLVAVNILKPGAGMNVDVSKLNPSVVEPYVKLTHEVGFVPFLMNIIPGTFVGAFTEGNILQVLFIAILSGFALVWLGDRAKPLVDIIEIAAQDGVRHRRHRDVDGAARRLRRHRVHRRQVRRRLAGFARQAFARLLSDLHHLHHRRLRPAGARFCGFSLLKLIRYIKEELLICIATTSSETVLPRHHGQAGAAWLREERRRARGADRLFVQSRRHLPLSRDRRRVPGAGHQHAARYLASDRAAC